MADYRLYFHDRWGHFARAEDIAESSDVEAIQWAREFSHGYCVEVWERGRKVGTVAPVKNADRMSRLAFG